MDGREVSRPHPLEHEQQVARPAVPGQVQKPASLGAARGGLAHEPVLDLGHGELVAGTVLAE